ncbi:type II secretion system protein GspM [Variovorax terrae]|uniref:Type II secretion system protein GspM n=1 Tax=Variovorax terrae TaxID=2923278 RepID=A0A9X1VWA1_9BURK|nr:type II secretion system protein GspM [Variovorax terrae]MCJ0764936.1 type II secretion system protein GspM [Variovorax terrae]
MKLPPAVQARWNALAVREKSLLLGAAALVAAALLWWLALAPALRTLGAAEAQHRSLDAQLQHMLSLQAQAQALQSQPKLGYDEALRALETSVKQRLGATAQLSVLGDRATVTLRGTPADALAQWLAQARINARALPTDARLTRTAAGASWDGTLVLSLPAR